MIRTFISALALCVVPATFAQVLLGDSLLLTYTTEELVDWGVGNASNGIEIHRILYATVDPFGQPTVASGALVLPLVDCSFPLAAYMHGTILDREDVPSRLSDEIVVGYFLGGTGYVTVRGRILISMLVRRPRLPLTCCVRRASSVRLEMWT
jgi:hypothetical protein